MINKRKKRIFGKKKGNGNDEVIVMNPINDMFEDSAYFGLNQVHGKHDVKMLKRELDALPGVTSVSVNPEDNSLSVDYNRNDISRETISLHLQQLGYLEQPDSF